MRDRRRAVYFDQVNAAKGRGIKWGFTFESWVTWWEDKLGQDWMTLRGCRRGQYVMARNGDEGPYEPWNVICIRQEDNHAYANKKRKLNGKKRKPRRKDLPVQTVLAIFRDERAYKEIREQYGVDDVCIWGIKSKRHYRVYLVDEPISG